MSIERMLPTHAITAVKNDLRNGQTKSSVRQPVAQPLQDRSSHDVILSEARVHLRTQDVDTTRVAELRQLMHEGKLSIEPGCVADALLRNNYDEIR